MKHLCYRQGSSISRLESVATFVPTLNWDYLVLSSCCHLCRQNVEATPEAGSALIVSLCAANATARAFDVYQDMMLFAAGIHTQVTGLATPLSALCACGVAEHQRAQDCAGCWGVRGVGRSTHAASVPLCFEPCPSPHAGYQGREGAESFSLEIGLVLGLLTFVAITLTSILSYMQATRKSRARDVQQNALVTAVAPNAEALASLATAFARMGDLERALAFYAQIKADRRRASHPIFPNPLCNARMRPLVTCCQRNASGKAPNRLDSSAFILCFLQSIESGN